MQKILRMNFHLNIVIIIGLVIATVASNGKSNIEDRGLQDHGKSSSRSRRQAIRSNENPGEKIYYLMDKRIKVNWVDAQDVCKNRGYQLASIESEQENRQLLRQLHDSKLGWQHVWTSGEDLNSDGFFKWNSTGNQFTFVDWLNGQQGRRYDDETYENACCVEILLANGNYKWQDDLCSERKYVVCERASPRPNIVEIADERPSVIYQFPGYQVTEKGARGICERLGYKLARMDTAEDERFLIKRAREIARFSHDNFWFHQDDTNDEWCRMLTIDTSLTRVDKQWKKCNEQYRPLCSRPIK